MAQSSLVKIHPTALVEEGVQIGEHTSVWDNVHIRTKAKIGHHCIIGEKSYIAYDVRIGNYVKINAFVYIPTGVTVEDKVMIAAGAIFVNDKYPRAYDFRGEGLLSSAPGEETLETLVKEGATVGAAAVILGGLTLGKFCLVGAGSVVTKSVKDHALVVGNPAKQIGWVCRCGHKLALKKSSARCQPCRKSWKLIKGSLKAV